MARRQISRLALLTVAAIAVSTGCATIRRSQTRDTQQLLAAAGFKMQFADAADTTPGDSTPPYRLVSRTTNGVVHYTYADPDNCRCVYVGGPEEYSE